MRKLKELIKEKRMGEKNRFEQVVVVIALALLLGLLAGFFSHDHLTRFNPEHAAWKSWFIH